jgi:hypothetical protein
MPSARRSDSRSGGTSLRTQRSQLEIVSIRVSSTQKAMPSGCSAMRRLSRRTRPDRSPWRPLRGGRDGSAQACDAAADYDDIQAREGQSGDMRVQRTVVYR